MKKTLYVLKIIVSIILITALYAHVLLSYNEMMGLYVSDDGQLALGIELTDKKKVVLFDENGDVKSEIILEIMGVYKFSYDGEYVTIYPKRTDKWLKYSPDGKIVETGPFTYDEYKEIPENPITQVGANGITYKANIVLGYTTINRVENGNATLIYHSDARSVNFRVTFIVVCYIISVFLCVYIFRMSKGKYDVKNN